MVIQPTRYEKIGDNDFLIFLAGPIQGAVDWQQQAIDYMLNVVASCTHMHIASPRRLDAKMEADFKFDAYAEQIDWETFYLNRAAKCGAILFWLAKESWHDCDRAFAQTSRFELGEWKAKHERHGVNIVVGLDSPFSGSRYIMHRLAKDCPGISIETDFKKACDDVMFYYLQWRANRIVDLLE